MLIAQSEKGLIETPEDLIKNQTESQEELKSENQEAKDE